MKPLQGHHKEKKTRKEGRKCLSPLSSLNPPHKHPTPCHKMYGERSALAVFWHGAQSLSPPLFLWGSSCSPGLCSPANLVGVFSDWKAVACSPQNFTLHFSISLGAAANISPAWFAGYCHKSDLGLKKISRPVKALSFYFSDSIQW